MIYQNLKIHKKKILPNDEQMTIFIPDTLRVYSQTVYILTEFFIDHLCRQGEFNSAIPLFKFYRGIGYNLSLAREGSNALKSGF
ncbi:hypothetical protein T4C_10816 [Trichinella pseudospiralis]|uniref:Uncharacterized protein n=1 Tax=Trichinella pseudospiralis TaxID=6337 RepID=A0A0V1FTN4_TRIPS|nr:hypothetical protein T4D_16564 [Trichinella pseudospiralis]KRZ36032.1 hypothetical protein T4C_10816 [Trichinella pseudospiralis]